MLDLGHYDQLVEAHNLQATSVAAILKGGAINTESG